MFKGNCQQGVCAGYNSKDRLLSQSSVSQEMTLLPIYLLLLKRLSSFANSSEDTCPRTSQRPGVFHRTVEFPSCKTSFHCCSAKALGYWPSRGFLRGPTVLIGGMSNAGSGWGEEEKFYCHLCVGGYCENWYFRDVGNNLLYTSTWPIR